MNGYRVVRIGAGFAGAAILAAAFVSACGGGGGYSSGPTSPTTSTGGSATITLTSSGVSPKSLRIEPGQAVRFVNNDGRSHDMRSNPHPLHDACPPINNVSLLSPGQSKDTGVFASAISCGYHDLLDETNTNFQGSILVGTNTPPEGPVYIRPPQ